MVEANKSNYPGLHHFILEYDGLCELICNFVMENDLLGKGFKTIFDTSNSTIQWIGENHIQLKPEGRLKTEIKIDALNQDNIKDSHILNVTTFFEKLLAYFFNVYPHSLFSFTEKVAIDHKVNRPLFKDKLEQLSVNEYVKFQVFKKGLLSFSGHSMLIKKTAEKDENGAVLYSFFDPNEGEFKKLNCEKLCDKIDKSMDVYSGTHMAFLNGEQYLKRLKPDLNDEKDDPAVSFRP